MKELISICVGIASTVVIMEIVTFIWPIPPSNPVIIGIVFAVSFCVGFFPTLSYMDNRDA